MPTTAPIGGPPQAASQHAGAHGRRQAADRRSKYERPTQRLARDAPERRRCRSEIHHQLQASAPAPTAVIEPLTLRAESAFGILPELDKSKILPDYIRDIEIALERVLSSAYRELPQSIVDHCRNAAVMIISR